MYRIINVRGTSGTGKTTIVKELLERTEARPFIIDQTGKKPKVRAYLGHHNGTTVVFLGSYEQTCGGCDTIPKVGIVADLLQTCVDNLADELVIIFEGLMISHMLGTVGAKLAELGKENTVLAWLDTPLDVALQRVQQRRWDRGDDRPFNTENTEKDYRANELCQANAKRQGFRVEMIGHKNAHGNFQDLFNRMVREMADG